MHIEITQPHTLGITEAKHRIMSMGGSLPAGVTLVDATWTEATNTAVAHLSVHVLNHDVPVVTNIVVAPAVVVLQTSDLPWYAAPFVPLARAEIRTMLATLLHT